MWRISKVKLDRPLVLGATKRLTARLAKAGVGILEKLVRLCAEGSQGVEIAVGCSRGWYEDPSSPYKHRHFRLWERPLSENPSIRTESARSNFVNELWKLLDDDDPGYRTEFNITYPIPREEITNKELDLSAQVGLVADALLKTEGPLEFLMTNVG